MFTSSRIISELHKVLQRDKVFFMLAILLELVGMTFFKVIRFTISQYFFFGSGLKFDVVDKSLSNYQPSLQLESA